MNPKPFIHAVPKSFRVRRGRWWLKTDNGSRTITMELLLREAAIHFVIVFSFAALVMWARP